MYLNIIKAIYDKTTASIILNGEKLKPFPIIRKVTRMPTIPIPIQLVLEHLARTIRQDIGIKGI
jgi:hypothetical protein